MVKFFWRLINKINDDFKEHLVKTGIAISILVTVYLLSGDIFLSFIIGSALAILLLGWDSRVFVALGLIFLITCPFLLAFEKKSLAEEMAVYAYYMLVLGIVIQIIQYFKEEIILKNKIKKSQNNNPREIGQWKAILVFSGVIVSVLLIVFVFGLYFLNLKIDKKFKANEQSLDDLLNSRWEALLLTKGKVNPEQLASTTDVVENTEVTWDSVQVLIRHTSEQLSLAETLAEKFRKIGITKVDMRQVADAPEQNTGLQYCGACANIAVELLATLENSSDLVSQEDQSLVNEIVVTLGADQLVVIPGEISVAILNGTITSGVARQLQTSMLEQGFIVSRIGDADKKDYQSTIIKYSANNLIKANRIKDYLATSYNNLELLEDQNISTDVEIILGKP